MYFILGFLAPLVGATPTLAPTCSNILDPNPHQTVARQFLREFWSEKSGILGVQVSPGDLWVEVLPTHHGLVETALPQKLFGRAVHVILSDSRPQTLNPKEARRELRRTHKNLIEFAGEYYIEPPVLLITGTSAGIGLEMAKLLKDSRYRLVLTSRENSLPVLAQNGVLENERIMVRPLDVADPAQRKKVVDEVIERWGGVDVLINNAGISYRSVTEHMNKEATEHQMAVNFFGPIELANQVIPLMRMKGRGKVINVSSMCGVMGMPTMGSYSASKFALEGAMESLYYEMKPWGVQVALVQPGFVNSDSHERVVYTNEGQRSEARETDPYHAYYRNMTPFISKLMGFSLSSASDVAKTVVKTMERRLSPLRVSATADAVFFKMLRKIMPSLLYEQIMYRNLPGLKDWGRNSSEFQTHLLPPSELDEDE